MSELTKAEIVAELEAMAWYRLFNCRQWLADRETVCAVNQKLIKMGLVEPFRRTPGEIRPWEWSSMSICSKCSWGSCVNDSG